jgi:hypothetical protein
MAHDRLDCQTDEGRAALSSRKGEIGPAAKGQGDQEFREWVQVVTPEATRTDSFTPEERADILEAALERLAHRLRTELPDGVLWSGCQTQAAPGRDRVR